MSDLFLTHRLGRQRHLCVSELSPDTLAEHGLKGPAFKAGLYLYTLDDRPRVGGISVLARVPTTDAAFEIVDLFKSTARTTRATHKKKAARRETSRTPSKRGKRPKTAGRGRIKTMNTA
jgi:hypothetical protein